MPCLSQLMLSETRNLLSRGYGAGLPLNFAVQTSSEPLGDQVFSDRYDVTYPDRSKWNEYDILDPEPSDTTAAGTSKLTIEEIEKESPVDPIMFGPGGLKAQWAHIKEWSRDGCTSRAGADTNNRLILDSAHHEMYDARGGGDVCGVTFFMDEADNNTSEQTTLHVLYANKDVANTQHKNLRKPTLKGTNHYTVQIQHPDPAGLKVYLAVRHNRIVSESESFQSLLP
eukprot:TRINITY_DN10253_c0_g1_i3.p1 TRINITY_DN10253_c0_g1~~TRINITY_DN10253_c0_g1_i3.p1  ORF type:complete len:227 (+),score=13.25 TRINITY_DN10253_c0_g1_i3:256-936(+)